MNRHTRISLAFFALLLGSLALLTGRPARVGAQEVTLTVNRIGEGTVTVNPGPPYTVGQTVTLTAVPAVGWDFVSWDVTGNQKWWDNGWDYRVPVTVGADGHARKNKPVDVKVNFTTVLNSLGKTGALDPNSIRVVEVDENDNVIDDEVVSQFDPEATYNASTNALGTVIFIMEGNTGANQSRRYHIYFDVTGKNFAPPAYTPQVIVTDGIKDQGEDSFKIQTNVGTLYYHKKGAGFSSYDDLNGNDWIGWSNATGSEGKDRGIPNMVYPDDGGHFHPGLRSATSTLVNQGPIKATVVSTVSKGVSKWKATWEFYPEYATMTLQQATFEYWFLYEGTPGGKLELNTDYMVRSDGTQTNLGTSWVGDLVGEEWVFFSDPNVGRSLFLAHHDDDQLTDSYKPIKSDMTAFGFGRNDRQNYMSAVPNQFTFGLIETLTYDPAAGMIRGAYKALQVNQANGQVRLGAALGNKNPASFTLKGDHVITATFSQQQYDLLVTVNGQGTVSKQPDKAKYGFGEQVTLTAAPEFGWTFDGWGGALSGNQNPTTITITGNTSVSASFSQALVINRTVNGEGEIVLDPDKPAYLSGEVITATAAPDLGWSFAGWSGDLTGTQNPQTVTVTRDLSITATFTEERYSLTVNKIGNGTADWSPKQADYGYGDLVTFTAAADEGWYFDGWSGDLISENETESFTITGNTVVTATFSELQYYSVTVTTAGQGTVTKSPDQDEYLTGTGVTLTATPADGWFFSGWSGDLTGSANPASITVDSDKVITATFVQETYPLNVTVIGQGQVTKNPNKAEYAKGESVTLTAAPQIGWVFSNWSGDATGSTTSVTVTVDGPKNVTATFILGDTYELIVNTQGNGDVLVDPDKAEYLAGERVTLTAVPNPGYVFVGWTGDVSGITNPVKVTMDRDKEVTARFAQSIKAESDAFNYCAIADSPWQFLDPVGDANPDKTSTLEFTGTHARITIPGGINHEMLPTGNLTSRLMQQTVNTDMQLEVKFDSPVSQRFQQQGLVIEQNEQNFLRFEVYSDGTAVHIYSASYIGGTFKRRVDTTVNAFSAVRLRVTRTNDTWKFQYALDNGALIDAVTFKQALTATAVGVYAGNQGWRQTPAPEHTAIIDYFYNLADGATPTDKSLLTVNVAGQGTVQRNPNQPLYQCGANVQLTATPANGWNFGGWSGDASGSNRTVTVQLSGPKTVTATFTQVSPQRRVMLPVVISRP